MREGNNCERYGSTRRVLDSSCGSLSVGILLVLFNRSLSIIDGSNKLLFSELVITIEKKAFGIVYFATFPAGGSRLIDCFMGILL